MQPWLARPRPGSNRPSRRRLLKPTPSGPKPNLPRQDPLLGQVGLMEKCRVPPGAEPRRAVMFAINDARGVHAVGTNIALQFGLFVDRERCVAEGTGMA